MCISKAPLVKTKGCQNNLVINLPPNECQCFVIGQKGEGGHTLPSLICTLPVCLLTNSAALHRPSLHVQIRIIMDHALVIEVMIVELLNERQNHKK